MLEVFFSNKNEYLLDFAHASILVEIESVHNLNSIKMNLKIFLFTMNIVIKFFTLKDKRKMAIDSVEKKEGFIEKLMGLIFTKKATASSS